MKGWSNWSLRSSPTTSTRDVSEAKERQTGEKVTVRTTVRSSVARSSKGRRATRATKATQGATRAKKNPKVLTTTKWPGERARREIQSSSATVSPKKCVRYFHGSPNRETNNDGNSTADDNDLPVMSGTLLAPPATTSGSDHPSPAPPDSEDIKEAEEAFRQSKERLEHLMARKRATQAPEKAPESAISSLTSDLDITMDESVQDWKSRLSARPPQHRRRGSQHCIPLLNHRRRKMRHLMPHRGPRKLPQ